MASSAALCCVTSSAATAAAATAMRGAAPVPVPGSSSGSSGSSSMSFSLVGAPPALMGGLKMSSSSSYSVSFSGRRRGVHLEQSFRRLSIRAADANATADAVVAPEGSGGGTGNVDTSSPPTGPVAVTPPAIPRKKTRVSLQPARKQRVILRFLWLEKNIGISLDQVVPGYGVIPLSPYFFWPRKDAWEELKAKLDSKRWISRKRTIILLNQATDIINLWQQSRTNSF